MVSDGIVDPSSGEAAGPPAGELSGPLPVEPRIHARRASAASAARASGALLPLWSAKFEGRFTAHVQLVAVGDRLLVCDFEHLCLLEATSGAPRWALRIGQGHCLCAATPDTALLGSAHPHLFGIRLANGAVRWRAPVAGRICAAPLALPRGRFACATEAGEVILASARDGQRIWISQVRGAVIAAPCASGDLLLVGTAAGELWALDLATGRPRARLGFAEQRVPGPRGQLVQAVLAMAAGRGRAWVRVPAGVGEVELPRLKVVRAAALAEGAAPGRGLAALPGGIAFCEAMPGAFGGEGGAGPLAGGRGRLRVLDAANLSPRWERPCEILAPLPVALDPRRWAVLDPRPRQATRGGASLSLVHGRTGEVIERQDLGQAEPGGAALAVSGSRLFVACGDRLWALAPRP